MFGGLRGREDEDIKIVIYFVNYSPTDAFAHSRRSESLATPIWEPPHLPLKDLMKFFSICERSLYYILCPQFYLVFSRFKLIQIPFYQTIFGPQSLGGKKKSWRPSGESWGWAWEVHVLDVCLTITNGDDIAGKSCNFELCETSREIGITTIYFSCS